MKNKLTVFILSIMLVLSAVCFAACSGEAGDPSVTLDKTELTMVVGEKKTLTATVKNAGSAKVVFSSGKKSVATVDEASGEITAVAAGSAKIFATVTVDGNKYDASCNVTVTEKALPSVALDKTEATVKIGETCKLTATKTNADNATVSYSTNKPAVATVADDGTVTAVGAGGATITAKITVDGVDYTATCEVTVPEPAPVPSIALSKTTLSLTAGDTYKLVATKDNADAAVVSYSSNKPTIASVAEDGTVKALSPGEAVITAKITVEGKDYSAECAVTVEPDTSPKVILDTGKVVLAKTKTKKLTAVTQNLGTATVSYSSDTPAVATVADDGTVTAVAAGKAVITAKVTVGSTEYKDTCKVTVAKDIRLKTDFIKGVDMSAVISVEESGATFKNADGKVTDVFEVLADSGVTSIRVRIWNDPYDSEGRGYGGGNSDLAKAIAIGKRATMYGMDLLVDFHYSDFWSDPVKYKAPKAWENFTIDQKETALGKFTKDCLNAMKDAGIAVGMVQVGNETTYGMCGEVANSSNNYDWTNIARLMNAGSAAVREVYPDAYVAVHFTDPQNGRLPGLAAALKSKNVDYDVFGTSYYPCYHGSLTNLKSVLEGIQNTYDKYVMVLETQYPYIAQDTDGGGTTLGSTKKDAVNEKYDYSVQGQYNMVKDVFDTVAELDRGLGVYYWEGAWITVDGTTGWTKEKYDKWMQYGSGWASKYAAGYDSHVTLKSDGEMDGAGSQVDNQAFFDYLGRPLDSLNVFNLSYTVGGGAATPPQENGTLQNGGFESDMTGWTAAAITGTAPTGDNFGPHTTDPKEGTKAFHYYTTEALSFKIEQTVTNVLAGTYTFSIYIQGDTKTTDVYAKADVGGSVTQSAVHVTLTEWNDWKEVTVTFTVPTTSDVTVGIYVTCDAGGWGTIDSATLTKQ